MMGFIFPDLCAGSLGRAEHPPATGSREGIACFAFLTSLSVFSSPESLPVPLWGSSRGGLRFQLGSIHLGSGRDQIIP